LAAVLSFSLIRSLIRPTVRSGATSVLESSNKRDKNAHQYAKTQPDSLSNFLADFTTDIFGDLNMYGSNGMRNGMRTENVC